MSTSELERKSIVEDLIVWKKIRKEGGRSLSIQYVIDVSDKILNNKSFKNDLLYNMSLEQRIDIEDAYINDKSSSTINIPEENFSGRRYLLLGAPGPLTENRISTLKDTCNSQKTKKYKKHNNLRKYLNKKIPRI